MDKLASATYDGVALCRVGGLVSEEARRFDSAATTATFAAAAVNANTHTCARARTRLTSGIIDDLIDNYESRV